ncbi:hydroxyisourate hydrolase [Bisbaumannia pacifica]|uniref:5-hydroxyisourate hydrolase n=1 Tax=Bisbaumannia pacifica TaxID=77098 RepID=A0ABD4L519_9GAMM|nr:hydroxyisourate hydrolase [Halomonas pacifica]MBH8581849.1 hydroxyisourate hydrolase [Halomonas pacifica]
MITRYRLITALGLCAATLPALAADNPLSVHVLDIQTGQPSPGIEVHLERHTDGGWQPLASGETASSGRISALYPEQTPFEPGAYRVIFATGDWFAEQDTETFFPEIPVHFEVTDAEQHYHIPLLLSPYGYSTYRGN